MSQYYNLIIHSLSLKLLFILFTILLKNALGSYNFDSVFKNNVVGVIRLKKKCIILNLCTLLQI